MKNILKKIMVLSLTLILMLVLAGCTTYDNFKSAFFETAKSNDTITIGVLEPQSGEDSQYGKEEIQGIELANEQFQEVLGKKIVLVYEDTQSSIYTTKSAIEDLISYNPLLILGCYGNANALTAVKYIEAAKIPAIGISVTNNLVTDNYEYYLSIAFNDKTQGKALGNYASTKLGSKKIALFRQADDDSTVEVSNRFIKAAKEPISKKKAGAKLVAKTYYNIGETDYTAALQKIISQEADTVFCPVSIEVADALFTQVENLRMTDLTFIGTTAWYNDDFLKMMKKHPNIKVILASEFVSDEASNEDSKTVDEFVKAYKEKYGETKEPSERVALAYDAYMLAVKSIEKAGVEDKDKILEKLLETEKFNGVTGKITLNSKGRAVKAITISTIKQNKFVSLDTIK